MEKDTRTTGHQKRAGVPILTLEKNKFKLKTVKSKKGKAFYHNKVISL
jgi:hypothetical protein